MFGLFWRTHSYFCWGNSNCTPWPTCLGFSTSVPKYLTDNSEYEEFVSTLKQGKDFAPWSVKSISFFLQLQFLSKLNIRLVPDPIRSINGNDPSLARNCHTRGKVTQALELRARDHIHIGRLMIEHTRSISRARKLPWVDQSGCMFV